MKFEGMKPLIELTGTYDGLLVAISVLAAIISAFVAISIVPRITAKGADSNAWLWVAAFGMSLGAGIWTMHFIAILAFHLPIPYVFNLPLTFLSLLLAVVSSAAAIVPLRFGKTLSLRSPATYFIGTMMGLGIAGMHYAGMAAMKLNAIMHHDMAIIVLAVAIAVMASIAALAIASQLRDSRIFKQMSVKILAAVVMGMAVSAMHYTAMYGMHFHTTEQQHSFTMSVEPHVLAIFIMSVAFLVQGGLIIAAIFSEAYGVAKDATERMKMRAGLNKALSLILSICLKKTSIEEKLQQILEIILSLDALTIKKSGCIYLADNRDKKLHMVAEHQLDAALIKRCHSLHYGECLCGGAAESGQVVYKNCLDDNHTITFEGMSEHGHYVLPIMSEGEVIAVLNLYLEHGHQRDKAVDRFLAMAADALSVIIRSHHIEEDALKVLTAVDQAGEAIMISDTKGLIEYVNESFSRITGYSAEEAIGSRTSLLKSGTQPRSFYTQMWNTINAGNVWSSEVVQKSKFDRFYPALLTISPSRNAQGEITRFIGIHSDLSEQKNLEAQFRQAQKMEAIGTLTGGIAHDFNNMLAAILGNLYLAKKINNDPESLLKRLDSIEQVSLRATSMIQQLLTFSRKDMTHMQHVLLPEFVDEAMELLRSSGPENIKLVLDICSEPLMVWGDATLLHQVLMNLVINARDALKGNKDPMITVSLRPFYADADWVDNHVDFIVGEYALLTVADNGEGISAHDVENIFEPFFTTKPQGKGTGLGLSMVFGAVKSHSGVIRIQTDVQEGAVFELYLPIIKGLEDKLIQTPVIAVQSAKGETILLADDEETVRTTTAEFLEMLGYQVLQAADGEEGMDVFNQHFNSIDLAILDVVMPKVGGLELSEHMHRIKPSTPILFVSGYDRGQTFENYELAENSETLTKPVDFNRLSQKIRHFLDH